MKNNNDSIDPKNPDQRRRFLRLIGTAAALLPIAAITGCSDETPPPARPSPQPDPEPSMQPESTPEPEPEPEPAQETAQQATEQLPELSLDDPTAKALGYRHDAANVDLQKFPQRGAPAAANHYCRNCTLFQGAEGDAWGPCTLFPGRRVNANGWCSGYTPKAG